MGQVSVELWVSKAVFLGAVAHGASVLAEDHTHVVGRAVIDEGHARRAGGKCVAIQGRA